MKPSEKIIAKTNKYLEDAPRGDGTGDLLLAICVQFRSILEYLDEEWEKDQPCKEHTYASEHRDERCTRCLKRRITPV